MTAEWQLTAAGYAAVVTEVGATLRELRFQGRDLVVPFDAGQVRPFYRGATIAPWPNRIADGRYSFDGRIYQLPINEVDRHCALHGLVHWVRWDLVSAADDRLVLQHELVPQDGYPFPLHLRIEYQLSPNGLQTRLTATNTGSTAVPYGCCPHPYLIAGPGPLDSWSLTVPADQRLEVDGRLLPTRLTPVDDVDCDFRHPKPIGGREIDHAFTGIAFSNGRAHVDVVDPATGAGVRLDWGTWAPWLQIHTADRPEPQHNRVGLAVEPMNCPPDAFNHPGGPPLLQSGHTHEAEWKISAFALAG